MACARPNSLNRREQTDALTAAVKGGSQDSIDFGFAETKSAKRLVGMLTEIRCRHMFSGVAFGAVDWKTGRPDCPQGGVGHGNDHRGRCDLRVPYEVFVISHGCAEDIPRSQKL